MELQNNIQSADLRDYFDMRVRKLWAHVRHARAQTRLSCGCVIPPGHPYVNAGLKTRFGAKPRFSYLKLHAANPCELAKQYFPTIN